MAAPLITRDQIVVRLGRPFTAAENIRIDAVITDISAAIRNYTGQHILTETTTQLLRVTNGVVRLPQLPVTAVTSVTDTHATALSYVWATGAEFIELDSAWYLNVWEINTTVTGRHRQVLVNYTHGYATVPDDIVAVGCMIATRALTTGPEVTGIVQESIAGYSYTIGGNTPTGPFGVLDSERQILDGYRNKVPAGPIAMTL